MNNREKSFLQKIKDNAFYLSLGVGMLAILAVVAVYTTQQNETKLAENQLDLNVASDYSDLITEETVLESEEEVAETNAEVLSETDSELQKDDTLTGVVVDTEDMEESHLSDIEGADKETNAEQTDSTEVGTEEVGETSVEEETSIPVTVNAGELDFNSEKTITWPVNGEVILPYSMETTVYFETLEQYQCNPGMLIQTGIGTTVQNAYLGQVTKVTSDNTYGNLVTLYIGNDYSIVYGQLDTVYVKEGDFVKAGQSIGTVGNPTDSFKNEGSHLFFQMLHGEETVDPMMFIE